MALRLTDAQFAAWTGQKIEKVKKEVAIAGGYRSKWSGKKTVGGKICNFRSLWEYNYACYLEWLKLNNHIHDWFFEPKKFDFPRGLYKTTPFCYLIDFQVYNNKGLVEWHEVKGVMNPKSVKRIKRFHKHFPDEGSVVVIGKEWFKNNGKKLCKLVPGWTTLPNMR